MSSNAKPPILSCDYSLLDKVDKLRELGMQEFFPLPQIAVVGDQSSGKSSLLEYISGVTFPKDSQMCTCFPTEVIMRPEPVFSAEILLKNQVDSRLPVPNSPDEVADVIKQAKDILAGENKTTQIYDEVLTVKLRGPELSSLTLVDLPGYIHTHSEGQDEHIVAKIKALSEKYLKSPSTIILAVIPATADFESNVVIEQIREFDEKGERTLCVVTKPDRVDPGTEGRILEILSGKKLTLSRGYHVVRNRNYEDCRVAISREATAEKEANFFAAQPWSKVDPWHRGVERLVAKLTEILTDQVQKEFPGIRKMILERKEEDENLLASLGPGIETDIDKILLVQSKLTQITRKLKYLVDGQYSAVEYGSELYIRAHIKCYNLNFRRKILCVTKCKLKTLPVGDIIKRSRGRELEGMILFEAFVVLFRKIIDWWAEPTERYVDDVCGMFHRVSSEVIQDECPKVLLEYFLERMNEYLDQQKKQILTDVYEILDDESTPATCQPLSPVNCNSEPMLPTSHFPPSKTRDRIVPCEPFERDQEDSEERDTTSEHSQMREMLKNYGQLASERFVDAIILYAVERNLFKKCENRITEFFNANKRDLSRIRESSHISSLRQTLPENIRKFKDALEEF